MDFIPDRLLKGIAGNKRVAPNPNGYYSPTGTVVVNNPKMSHLLGKLAQAGVADDGASAVLGLPTTTSTTYPQKITHGIDKLMNAGLSVDDNTPSSPHKSRHGLATKYIIVIAVVSAVILLALLAGGFLCFRRYRRRRAYNVVSRGVDKKGKAPMREKEDMFNADLGEAESFDVGGQKLTERNFESGYDKVDTGYESTSYGAIDEAGGDKRARLEA
ncbi:hypothetical protein H2200_004980 [Cladophialophora chaetospira]|uniref:Uncharacterized protein n=1 Tax=Cladophialophora chaetospira TaxID=386627 RepID=A0AA38XB34_9EURO|nr:hypothetical protein H2200_004980 [Cladophialophora chaetospira]